jgi:hypothetical protein
VKSPIAWITICFTLSSNLFPTKSPKELPISTVIVLIIVPFITKLPSTKFSELYIKNASKSIKGKNTSK